MARCVTMYRALLACPPTPLHLLTLLANLETLAHTNHYVLLQAKMKFVMLTSSEPGVLSRQVELCQEVLAVLDPYSERTTKAKIQKKFTC